MSHWVAPIDPECPVVKEFYQSLVTDPMIRYSGVGDDLEEDFKKKHNQECHRCQLYGVENIEAVPDA